MIVCRLQQLDLFSLVDRSTCFCS